MEPKTQNREYHDLNVKLTDEECEYMAQAPKEALEDIFLIAGLIVDSPVDPMDVGKIIDDICPNILLEQGSRYFIAVTLKIALAYAESKRLTWFNQFTQRPPKGVQ